MSRAKRGATTDLNHDNWDQEEDKEEAGVFRQAPPEEISRRVIKQAVRRRPVALDSNNSAGEINKNAFGSLNMQIPEAKPNAVFSAFNFLGSSESKVPKDIQIINRENHTADQVSKGTFQSSLHGTATLGAKPTAAAPSFDFLSGVKDGNSSTTINSNGINEVTTTLSNTEPKSVHEIPLMKNDDKEQEMDLAMRRTFNNDQRTPVFSSPSSLRDFVEPTYKKYSHLISKPPTDSKKIPGPNTSGRSEEFLQNMAEINESFSTWIQKNLAEDPTSILTRCFKDYIRHVQALFDEEKKGVVDENRLELIRKQEQVLNELVIPKT